jgi:hypothetical protein
MNEISKYAVSRDDRFAHWQEYAFTTESLPECDALVIFNTPFEEITTICDPGKVIAFMMEPGVKNLHPWMFKQLDQYAKVYSPIGHSDNTISSHGFLGWHLRQDYSFLKALELPAKTKRMSCIASDLTTLKGHRNRFNFVNALRKESLAIDFFGKGSNYVGDKISGLLPYQYSIAIENCSIENYFTEKINDCFLSYTVPLYYGCSNIGRYFPADSFINIDIENISKGIQQVADIISNDDWQSRLSALSEARELVLHKYQPLAGAADILRKIKNSEIKSVTIKPVQRGYEEKLKTAVSKVLRRQ